MGKKRTPTRAAPVVLDPDERALLGAVVGSEGAMRGGSVKAAAKSLGMKPGRFRELCERWLVRGWFEWGLCADAGRLTGEGRAAAGPVTQRLRRAYPKPEPYLVFAKPKKGRQPLNAGRGR